jgi:type I restriction enzyme M protein
MNHGEIVSFFWGVADLIRDTFKRGKYQDVILPLTVLRRLDCVLEGTKGKVLETHAKLKGRLENLDPQLRKASGYAFYNTSRFDFDRLLADAPHLTANLRNYINGFSPNMREILEKYEFDNTISKLDEAGLLFKVLERFKNVNLHPDVVDNPKGPDEGGSRVAIIMNGSPLRGCRRRGERNPPLDPRERLAGSPRRAS